MYMKNKQKKLKPTPGNILPLTTLPKHMLSEIISLLSKKEVLEIEKIKNKKVLSSITLNQWFERPPQIYDCPQVTECKSVTYAKL